MDESEREELEAESAARVAADDWGPDALAVHRALLRAAPGDEAEAVLAARCLVQLGRLSEAGELLRAVLAANPANTVARNWRDTVDRRVACRREAAELLEAGRLHAVLDQAKEREHRFELQIEGRRLLAEREGDLAAWCALGGAQRRAQERSGARHTYGVALRRDARPATNAGAFVGLAALERDEGHLAAARELAQSVLRVDRRDAGALLVLAAVYQDLAETHGRRDLLPPARELLRRAYAISDGDAKVKRAFHRQESLERGA
jgi:tetratricopeptide (TPR) repeat protein